MKCKMSLVGLLLAVVVAAVSALSQPTVSEAQTNPLDALTIDFYPLPENQLPLKKIMKHRINVTNGGSSALNFEFSTELIAPFSQAIDTITPEPNFLWLDPGESEYILTKLDEKWGKIPAFLPWEDNELGDYERTYRWTFTDLGTSSIRVLDITIPYKVIETERRVQEIDSPFSVLPSRGHGVAGPLTFGGTVINQLGEPLSGMEVFLTTGHWETSISETDTSGEFIFQDIPARDDWVLMAQQETNNMMTLAGADIPLWQDTKQPRALRFVNDSSKNISLELGYPEAQGEYKLVAFNEPDVGYWRGDVDDAGSAILLINGMENWGAEYPQQEAKSLLSLFSTDGGLIWSYNMGWEGWGTSLSRDREYAAFTTSNCGGKATRPVPAGVCGKFGVLSASDGSEIWTKNADDVTETTHPKLGSKEVEISNNNEFLAVGGVEGTFLLYELETGALVWTSFIRGQIRGILFDDSDSYIYAGSGDGYTYKLSVADGSVVWKTWNGSWPYLGAFKFSKQNDLLGVGGKYGDLAVIDPHTGNRLWYKDMDDIVSWLDFSPNGKYLVAGGGGQYATTLFEARTGNKIWHLPHYSHAGMFTSDGDYILAGETLLDLSGREIGNFSLPIDGCRPGCDGLFSFISDDLTRVIHTRRDMDPGAIGLYFWEGNIERYDGGVVKSLEEGLGVPGSPVKPGDVKVVPPNETFKPKPTGEEKSGQQQPTPFVQSPASPGDSDQVPGCLKLDSEGPCTNLEDPNLLACLEDAIGAIRLQEISSGSGPPPDERERTALETCSGSYQSVPSQPSTRQPNLDSTPDVPLATGAKTQTPVSLAVEATPLPTLEQNIETPVTSPISGGGCNSPVNTAHSVEIGWLGVGLVMPGIILGNLIRRRKNW